MSKIDLYIHEISISSSAVNIEDQVCKILAQIYIDKQRGLEKYDDVNN